MKIRDIMDVHERGVITIAFNETVATAVDKLITNKISSLPVLDDDGKIMGILSERDVIREAHANPDGFGSRYVGDAMTRDILVGLSGDDLDYIMNIMSRNNIRHMPIMEGRDLVGIISIRDVVKGLMHHVAAENRYLKDYIEGKYEGYL